MLPPDTPGDGPRAEPRSWLADAWPPFAVILLAYALIVFMMLRAFDFDPSGPIRIGTILPGAARFWTDSTRVDPGVGYDGQWFFYVAHDPLLRAPDLEAFLDRPAYRSARIVYPALSWLLAPGQPAALPWSMLAVNVLAVLGGTVACLDILRQVGASRWLALAFAFSPPFLIGVSAMLSEPTALALIAAGVALALRGRHWPAGIVLAASVLAREPSMLVPLGFGFYALGRLDWRRGAAYLLPLVVPVVFHLWIWAKMGILPMSESGSNFAVPFFGPYYRLGVLLGWHAPMLGESVPTMSVLAESIIVVTSAAIMLLGLTKVFWRRDAFAWLLWLQAALAAFTSPDIWVELYSYGRTLGPLYLAFSLMLLTSPSRSARFSGRFHQWTTFAPGRTILQNCLFPPVTSFVTPAFSTMKRTEKLS